MEGWREIDIFKYFLVLINTRVGGINMGVKQISLTIPEVLFDVSQEYSEEYGYRNIQDLILDMLRKKVVMENVERYREIEERMKKGESEKFDQKGALKYLKNL